MERFAKLVNICFLVFLALVLLGGVYDYFFVPRFPMPERVAFVSPIHLMATPDRFDGRKIFTVGYLVVEQEANRLYISEEAGLHLTFDYVDVVFMNSTVPADQVRAANRTWVAVNGTFVARGNSLWPMEIMVGMRPSQILDITRIEQRGPYPPGIVSVPGLPAQ